MTCNEKYCGGCRAVKPKSEFNRQHTSRDGLRNVCRSCQKRYAAKYRASHPKTPAQLAAQRAYNVAYRAKKRAQINQRRKLARAEQQRIDRIRRRWTEKDLTNRFSMVT